MKYRALVPLVVFLVSGQIFAANRGRETSSVAVFVNSIEGTVFDPSHRPVSDLWVELQSDVYMTIARVRTSGSGRFNFSNLRTGQYYVKVLTTGTDFESQTQSVELVSVVRNASDTAYLEVVLRTAKNRSHTLGPQIRDVVYAQEVPEDARRLYKSGVKSLETKDFEHGTDALIRAIKIFPDYYDALDALGQAYVNAKQYQESVPYLIKSININGRSFTSFYALAYAAYKLGHLPEAAKAAQEAVTLQPGSLNAQLLLGTALRMDGKYDLAVGPLERARKLSADSPVAEVHYQLALLYNHLKRNREAASELEMFLKIKPDAPNRKELESLIGQLRAKST